MCQVDQENFKIISNYKPRNIFQGIDSTLLKNAEAEIYATVAWSK
jgi:hypothetical protein